MAEPVDSKELPVATVVRPRRARISVVWIVPVLAAIVAIGIVVQRFISEGPTITIIFRAAEGIEAGKTLIKYKDVNIGQVTAVSLTDDFAKVEVKAKIAKHAAGLMVDDATFWIVRPSISLSGISGLSTLLSGNYIGFEAGKSFTSERAFTGLEVAPFIPGQPGKQFVLKAADLGSLGAGSPIYFRRLPVGQVISYGLAKDGKSVEVKIFVNAPYDKFVSHETRFWNASGVDITVDANGFGVHTESLVALLVGGLAFDTPDFLPAGQPALANWIFPLYGDRATAMKAPDAVARRYVLHFRESLRGLSVGAPVTFLGLPAGEVTSIGLSFDEKSANIGTRVVVTFFPERLLAYADPDLAAKVEASMAKNPQQRHAFLQRMVEERGLRAQLRSGSLITGQLYVALDYFPKAPKAKVDWSKETPELPVTGSNLVELEAKLTSILDKIDKMPLDAIGDSLKKDLDSLGETLTDARKLIGSTDTLVGNVDSKLVPPLKTDLEALQRVLQATEQAMKNVDATLLGPNAPAQQELRDALTEFTRAARSLRVLLDYLERHPESPLRGKTQSSSGGK
jgi:paraquat-inducible protein B